MDTNLKEYILELAAPLAEGQASGHEYCPMCQGGTSHEKSFIVRAGGRGSVYYRCYRSTCALGSGTLNGHKQFVHHATMNTFVPKPYKYETRSLLKHEYQFFRMKYELQESELDLNGVRYAPMRNSYVFPVYNHMGYEIGCNDRAYWNRTPKSIVYWFKDDVKLHFPKVVGTGTTLLVVEDQLSAIKGGRFMPSCALLGTGLSLDTAVYLSGMYKDVVLALDADASHKAITYRKKYGLLFRNFHTILLSKDIKDTTHVQLEEILREYVD